jgi:hypothetical protein
MPGVFQLFLVLLGVLTVWRTALQFQKRKVSAYWFVVWTAFWVVVIGVAFTPKTADVIAQSLGVGRAADLLVYCAVLLLFYGLYRVLSRTEKQHQEITGLVRRIGIMEAVREHKES